MSITNETDWTKRQDWLRTLLKQGNSCPICHLPLMYEWPLEKGGTLQADTDYHWNLTQQAMKKDESNNTYLFGTYPDTLNADKCHYVASTYIPEITRPMLYETPACVGNLLPDNGFYLFPDKIHPPVVKWMIRSLIPPKTPARRLLRVNDFLSITGTRWFLGCKDCNMSHTGHHQVALMVSELYNIPFIPDNDTVKSVASVYTLMFDCMTSGQNTIIVDEARCDTWQIELWINYCLIMFLAQNKSSENKTKFVDQKLTAWNYIFHYAHRDMGLCDFYMSQILAAILYARNDINHDFIWLHQNFLVILPIWARKNGLYECPESSYNSLWRLVLSDKNQDNYLPVAKELASANGTAYNDIDDNLYWYNVRDVRSAANKIMEKIIHFTETWLKPIGDAIDERNLDLDYTGNKAAILANLQSFYKLYTVDNYLSMRSLSTHKLIIDHNEINVYKYIEEDSSLNRLEWIFHSLLFGYGQKQIYRNTVLLAFSRTRVAYKKIESLVSGSGDDSQVSAQIDELKEKATTKWKTILLLTHHLIQPVHP